MQYVVISITSVLSDAYIIYFSICFSIYGLTSPVTEWSFRAGIMYAAENGDQNQQLRSSMFSLSGNGFFGTVGRSINLGLFRYPYNVIIYSTFPKEKEFTFLTWQAVKLL